MLRILLCGTGWLEVTGFIERAFAARGIEASLAVRDPRPLTLQLADVDVALPSNAHFGALEIAAAPNLRLIQQPAAGFEGIDRAAAHARGIPVCNAPGTNVDAVAQAALLLILALARRYPQARQAFGRAVIGTPIGIELGGRTLGIVGVGRTGARLGEIAAAIGMTVRGVRSKDGRAGFLAMLAASDVVSIHCPLDEHTRNLFDDEAFAAMKPGALLVNVARGGIIDRLALERALEGGRLGGVGLDVFWQEPWRADDSLFARPDVMVLPHVAGSTIEAFTRIADVVAHNVAALRDGTSLIHRID